MKQSRLFAACAAVTLSAQPITAALTLADVQFWTGPGSGPGISEAAVVFDWNDGQPPLVWGYRWDSAQRRTSADMLAAILGADPRLSLAGLAGGFVSHVGFDADLNGSPDRFRPGYDPAISSYWAYFVNNEVYYHPTDFSQNSHIVPPNTTVIPNGDPYAALFPGTWISSSTGVTGRELADGSWDGFIYDVGLVGPREPLPVSPIPEPAAPLLLVVAVLAGCQRRHRVVPGVLAALTAPVLAGPYPPAAGQPGSDAIPASSAKFTGWATGVSHVQRGLIQIDNPSYGSATYGNTNDNGDPVPIDFYVSGAADATPADPYNVLSLGDGGSMTLTFAQPIGNGPGPDLAVFENGFSYTATAFFMELAFVEVSSNGTDFFRFPAVSLTPTSTQMGTFGTIDPTNLLNLAGKYQAGYGTPFDLDELRSTSNKLNVNRITHVRIVDVVGSLSPTYGQRDSLGNLVNDPWPTPYDASGFDLDAVGVIHVSQAPWQLWRLRRFTTTELADGATSGPAADPDLDGRSNFLEYAVDGDPKAAERQQPINISWNNGLTIQYSRLPANSDLDYVLQKSSTGSGWANVVRSRAGAATTVLAGNAGVTVQESSSVPTTVTVKVPSSGARNFYRLQVAVSP